jgi:hypothetical protein
MDTRTGEIVSKDFVDDLRKQGKRTVRFYKEVPQSLEREIAGMNREQRRQWWRKNKKRIKDAS